MEKTEKSFQVGAYVKDLNGNLLQVVEVEGIWTRMKWVREDGSLSNGILWLVPSHLKDYEEVKKED